LVFDVKILTTLSDVLLNPFGSSPSKCYGLLKLPPLSVCGNTCVRRSCLCTLFNIYYIFPRPVSLRQRIIFKDALFLYVLATYPMTKLHLFLTSLARDCKYICVAVALLLPFCCSHVLRRKRIIRKKISHKNLKSTKSTNLVAFF
jgi:hypothetical protein